MQHSSATAGGRPFGQSFFRGPQYHPSLRRQMRSASLAGLTLATSLMLLSHPAQAVLAPDQAGMLSKASLSVLPFVANAGQWDARAAFAAPTFAGTLFVTTDGQLVYSLPPARKTATGGWALSESFVSATGKRIITAPVGDQPGAARSSDFTHTHAKASAHSTSGYQRVNLGDIYPGVNVQLRATRNNVGANVEKIFTVAPQHDPKQIQIKLEGANKLEVSAQGELIAPARSPSPHRLRFRKRRRESARRCPSPTRWTPRSNATASRWATTTPPARW